MPDPAEPAEKPVVAVIAGATATGKSAAAIAVAQALNGVIINADASQLYADLRILTARPGDADLAAAPHRLYGVLDGADACSAAAWAAMARAEIDAALAAGRLPILTGGSGLYLRVLIDGVAAVPEIAAEVRDEVRRLDPAAAYAALQVEDPAGAARLNPADRQRVMRALEVARATGRSLTDWQCTAASGIAGTRRIVAAVLDLDRTLLYRRCEARVETMFVQGAVAEVETLLARRLPADRPVMRAIGVPPIAAMLSGAIRPAEACIAVAAATRRYAKRQATWLRNQTPGWPRFDASLTSINQKLSEYFTQSAFSPAVPGTNR